MSTERPCRVAGCQNTTAMGLLCKTCWSEIGFDVKASLRAEKSQGGKARILALGIRRLEGRRVKGAP